MTGWTMMLVLRDRGYGVVLLDGELDSEMR